MRSDVEREIEADARSLAESVYPAYDPDGDGDLVQGPPVAWVTLDDEGDPRLCWGMTRGEEEDGRYVKLGEIPDQLWEEYESLIEDFEDGCDGDTAGEDAFYAALGDVGRWPR